MTDNGRGELHQFTLDSFDERYARYRLAAPEAETTLIGSLRQFGQLSPLVCCLREESPSLIDGYKRLAAARKIQEIEREISRIRLAAAAGSGKSQHRRTASDRKPRAVPAVSLRVLRALRQAV